jgi:hypothetical protein
VYIEWQAGVAEVGAADGRVSEALLRLKVIAMTSRNILAAEEDITTKSECGLQWRLLMTN